MIPITGNMAISLLTSENLLVISGSALAGLLLVFYMMSNEMVKINKTKQEIRGILSPLVISMFVLFVITLMNRILALSNI